jgi:hypothetical protein
MVVLRHRRDALATSMPCAFPRSCAAISVRRWTDRLDDLRISIAREA